MRFRVRAIALTMLVGMLVTAGASVASAIPPEHAFRARYRAAVMPTTSHYRLAFAGRGQATMLGSSTVSGGLALRPIGPCAKVAGTIRLTSALQPSISQVRSIVLALNGRLCRPSSSAQATMSGTFQTVSPSGAVIYGPSGVFTGRVSAAWVAVTLRGSFP